MNDVADVADQMGMVRGRIEKIEMSLKRGFHMIITDTMNSYFCSVGKDLADKISPVANPLDNISSYFLKLALPFIGNSLAFMFNTSIQTSMFPDSWKIARVTPIYKNGDRADKSNYRPISVLPVISRLFEKLI